MTHEDAMNAAWLSIRPPKSSCAGWCAEHITEADGGRIVEVCRGRVTVGDVTVNIEDSPSWGPEHRPVVPPDLTDYTAAGARDLAAALLEAARLVEDDRP